MTTIGNPNTLITLNGVNIDAKVKILDVSQKSAQDLLVNKKDGYDTIGARIGDKDILVLTQSKEKLLTTDQLKINGEIAELKFVENETNSTNEYLIENKNFASGIATTGVVGAIGGLGIGSLAKCIGSLRGAIAGAVVGVTLAFSAISSGNNKVKETSEEPTNGITHHKEMTITINMNESELALLSKK